MLNKQNQSTPEKMYERHLGKYMLKKGTGKALNSVFGCIWILERLMFLFVD